MPSSSSKGIAKNLFYKFADSLGLQKEDKPAPPPRPPQTWKPHEENLESAFNGLSLSSTPSPQPSSGSWSNAGFVGGFNPTFPVAQGLNVPQSPSAYFAPAPNLQPYAMPTPYSHQSLTMQMALQPESNTLKISRPHSTPLSTPPKLTAGSMSPSVSSGPSKPRPPASPSTPTKSNKSDTSDSPSRLSPKPGQEQCSGQTKAGNRCTRMVKIKPGDLVPYDGETPVERFCYQHQKEVLGERGYYSRLDNSKSLYVTFEIWIPSYLRPETQASLRAEMDKPRSNSDVHGYIYAFEIREQSEGDTIKLKVGRAVNLNKRIDQWGKQCGSKEQILRGFFPPNLEDEEGNSGSLMKGRIKAGEKGPWCHRLERLIHLELTDLATSAIYLDPAWPNVDTGSVSSATESKALKKSKCQDCGTMHKEIFEFKRWTRGPNEGKEYEELVKRVIERWGKYVELYV